MKIDGSDSAAGARALARRCAATSIRTGSAVCSPRRTNARANVLQAQLCAGYVWPIYDSYAIYRADSDGSQLSPFTRTPNDAEATIAPTALIVFTSVRDGDMESIQ
jgi:hypothetical protein